MIRFSLLGFLLLTLLIAGCERVAGGGTDQPNEIVAHVYDGSGEPLVGARVSLRKGRFVPDTSTALVQSTAPVIAEALSDSKGRFLISDVPAGESFLSLQSADSMRQSILPVVPEVDGGFRPGKIDLVEAARIAGRMHGDFEKVYSLGLSGTHYRAIVGEEGVFQFPPVLPGNYSLIGHAEMDGMPVFWFQESFRLVPGELLELDSVHVPPDSVVLFDFESTQTRSALRGILYPAEILTAGRVFINSTPQSVLPVENASAELSLSSIGAYRGKSLRINIRPNTHYRVNLGPEAYDFSKVRTISFYARATVDSLAVRVLFATEAVATGEGTFGATVTVGRQWSRIDIHPGDILPVSGASQSGLEWSAVNKGVGRISLITSQEAELWVDDLHLTGIHYGDLIKRVP